MLPATTSVDDNTPPPASGIEQILNIVRRADSITVKSEGTRVLAAAFKTLYTSEGDKDQSKRRRQAIELLTTHDSAEALAALVSRSAKFAVLVNEGIVALTLLAPTIALVVTASCQYKWIVATSS